MSEVEINQRLLEAAKDRQRTKRGEQTLEDLPQGHGSGLDADTVDGKHAEEIIKEAVEEASGYVVPSGGGGGGVGMAEHGNEYHAPDFAEETHTHVEADITDLEHDAQKIKTKTVDDAAIGDGKVLAYNLGADKIEFVAAAGIGDMTKAEYATGEAGKVDVALDSELLEGSTKAEVQTHAPAEHGNEAHAPDFAEEAHNHNLADLTEKNHASLAAVGENDHHTKFTVTEHDTTDRHSLGAVVPHDTLADLAAKSHTSLTDKGTNTHAEIDTHVGASAPHSGHEATANKGAANGYASLDADGDVPITQMPVAKVFTTLTFGKAGVQTVAANITLALVAPCTLTILKAKAYVKTAPTGAALIVDVNKNGTTIFTTQASRPQIAAGTNSDDSDAPDVTALAEGDILTLDVDQIGSTVAGADLTVEVVCTQEVVFS